MPSHVSASSTIAMEMETKQAAFWGGLLHSKHSSVHLQEDAVPPLMTLNRALMLLLLMASRQQEMTWFLGLPTEEKKQETQLNVVVQLLFLPRPSSSHQHPCSSAPL